MVCIRAPRLSRSTGKGKKVKQAQTKNREHVKDGIKYSKGTPSKNVQLKRLQQPGYGKYFNMTPNQALQVLGKATLYSGSTWLLCAHF